MRRWALGLTIALLVQPRRKAACSFWVGGVSRIDMLAGRITNNLLLAAVSSDDPHARREFALLP